MMHAMQLTEIEYEISSGHLAFGDFGADSRIFFKHVETTSSSSLKYLCWSVKWHDSSTSGSCGGGRELELPTFQPHKIHWLVEKPDTASPGCLDVPPSKTGAAVWLLIGLEMSEQPFGFRFYGAVVAVVLGSWLAGGFWIRNIVEVPIGAVLLGCRLNLQENVELGTCLHSYSIQVSTRDHW